MKPVFIMSSERSGSNLIREMLNAHQNISAPPAIQMPRILASYLPYYGDLRSDDKIKRIIEDALALNQAYPSPLDVQTSVDEIISVLPERTIWGVISTIYASHAKFHGKSCWVSKDNNLFEHAFAIKQTLPDARFIYLVRDGRDYASSMLRVGISSTHIYGIAKQWKKEQLACLKVFFSMGKDSVYLLRYEDLLADPSSTLQSVCEFLDEPFDAAMLNFHDQDTAKLLASQSAFWENLSKPVLSTNTGKFKTELSRKQIALFEAIAGHELILLGYSRVTNSQIKEPPRILRVWYLVLDALTRAIKTKRLAQSEQWRQGKKEAVVGIRAKLFSDVSPIENVKLIRYD